MSHAQTEGGEPSKKRTRTQMEQDDAKLDDVWVLVFKRLPFRDRIRVEGVCKKWRDLMPYTDVTKVNLNKLFATKDNKQRPEILKLTKNDGLLRVLMGVLDRCGRYLRWLDLELGAYPHSFLCWNKALADLVVEKASNVVVLNLTYRLVTLEGLFAMKNLTKLEELRMQQDAVDFTREADLSTPPPLDQIQSAVGATIQSLPSLKKLYLMSDTRPRVCPPVRNNSLRELRLSGRTVTAADVRDLVQHCPNLQVLDCRSLPDNLDIQLGVLGDLHQLRQLHLFRGFLTDGGLAAICRGCPKLEQLDLFVEGLTSCTELWRLPNLKCLSIATTGSVPVVDDAAIASVAKYGRLEKVSLIRADLTDEGLKKLALFCPNLMELGIFDINKITDEGLAVVLDSCKKLMGLNCRGTSIGDASVAAIGARAFNLRRCYMMDTRVTEPGLRSLIEEREKRLEEGAELQLKPLTLYHSLPCYIVGPQERLDRVNLIFESLF